MEPRPRDGMGPRKMYSGKWVCSSCQTEISELPFEPDPARLNQLLCRDCHRQRASKFRRPYNR